MVIYNLEEFAITHMLKPYQNLISQDEVEIKQIEKKTKDNPMYIYGLLEKNPKAKRHVYGRLAEINFEWYKYLKNEFTCFVNWEISKIRKIKETNYDRIMKMSLEELAKENIRNAEISEIDYDCEENTIEFIRSGYITSTEAFFDDYDEALEHEILWLKEDWEETE